MQWGFTDNGKYRIESLTASTFDGGLKVIREAFCQDEAVSIGTEVNLNPAAAEELLELCAYSALDGVSLVAIDVDTDEVAAVSFNKIQIPAIDAHERTFFEVFADERCKEESAQSLIKFMARVDAKCNLFEKYNADCSLEIMFLATLKEHRKQGLGNILCKVSIDLAKKLKNDPAKRLNPKDLGSKYSHIPASKEIKTYPKICQAIFTSHISQKLARSLGFTIDLTVPYTEFEFNEKTYADRIGEDSPYTALVSQVL